MIGQGVARFDGAAHRFLAGPGDEAIATVGDQRLGAVAQHGFQMARRRVRCGDQFLIGDPLSNGGIAFQQFDGQPARQDGVRFDSRSRDAFPQRADFGLDLPAIIHLQGRLGLGVPGDLHGGIQQFFPAGSLVPNGRNVLRDPPAVSGAASGRIPAPAVSPRRPCSAPAPAARPVP